MHTLDQPCPFAQLVVPAQWQCIEFISDLHLHPAEGATLNAWLHYMASTQADAIFILGDLFEVWVGDDQLDDFTQQCLQALAAASQRQPIYFIHGNRDFLIGQGFAHTTGTTLLADPTVLCWGNQRTVLSHGDLLCTDDTAYQEFRTLVRSTQWQNDFLAKPLAERQAIARHIRHQSETKKRETGHSIATDVNTTLARQWLALARATTLVHGHTHLPADHPLVSGVAGNLQRLVLSDWDLCHSPPRAEVLRWHRTANASAALSTRFERASLAQAQTGRPTP